MKFIYFIAIISLLINAQSISAMEAKASVNATVHDSILQCFKRIMCEDSPKKNDLLDICKKYQVLECYFFLEAYFINQEKIECQYATLMGMLSVFNKVQRLDALHKLIEQESHNTKELLAIISYIWMQPNYDSFSISEKPRVNFSSSLQQRLNRAFLENESFLFFDTILREIVDEAIQLLKSNHIDPLETINITPPKPPKEKCIVS